MIAGLAGAVVLVLVVPALGEGVFLFDLTTTGLLLAAALGAAGALLVEAVHRRQFRSGRHA